MTSANVYNIYAVAAASSSQVDSKTETDKKLKERSAALRQSQLIRTTCFWRPMIGHRNTSRITPFCTDTSSPDRQTKILKKNTRTGNKTQSTKNNASIEAISLLSEGDVLKHLLEFFFLKKHFHQKNTEWQFIFRATIKPFVEEAEKATNVSKLHKERNSPLIEKGRSASYNPLRHCIPW